SSFLILRKNFKSISVIVFIDFVSVFRKILDVRVIFVTVLF
ncbi:hypothetical protein LEP1GSC079_3206, partial [Leptospira interrogans str. FPW1039]